jgi:hypothetical protein
MRRGHRQKQALLPSVAAACLACLWIATAGAATTVPAGNPRCAPSGAQILAQDRSAQIFDNGSVSICERATVHVRKLRFPPEARAWPVRRSIDSADIAFPIFAFSWSGGQVDTGSSGIVVENFFSGKLIRLHAGLSERWQELESVPRIVVKRDGSVAWTAMSPPPGGDAGEAGRLVEVCAMDSSGFHVVERSSDIRPLSLSLRGSRLSWIQGDSRQVAQLH